MKQNELFDKIHKRIMNSLDNIVFEELHNEDTILDYEDFYIRIYKPRMRPESWTHNINDLKKFIIDGYRAKNDTKYAEFIVSNEQWSNVVAMKAAFLKSNEEMIALSIYKEHLNNYECAGICGTTVDEYKAISKKAIQEIIKYDINRREPFYWGEFCYIDRRISNFDGFRIPSVYVSELVVQNGSRTNLVYEDNSYEYTCYMPLSEANMTKKLYGFNDPDIFNKFVEQETEKYKQRTAIIENKLDSSLKDDSLVTAKVKISEQISNIIAADSDNDIYDFPPYILDKLKEYKDYLKYLLVNNIQTSDCSKERIFDEYDYEESCLERYSSLELHYIE